jgi:outer membrane protein
MNRSVLLLLTSLLLLSATSARAESLLQLWAHVVESNPTLKSSEYSVEQMRAQRDQVLAKLLPNVGISGFYSFNNYTQNATTNGFNPFGGAGSAYYTGFRGQLQAQQVLFDLPSYLRLEASDKQSKQSEQQALAQRMQLAYNLVDQYLGVLEASDIIAQLQAEQEATDSQANRMRHMHERQMAKVTDLYEIEAYGQSLLTSKIEAQHQKAIAAEKLRELTGTLSHEPDPLVQETFPEVKRDADDWVREALSSNPALLSLQYAAETAQSMIASAKAEHLPTASVSASEMYGNTGYNNLQYPTNYNIASLYLNVSIPIFAGGGVEAGAREAISKYQLSREKIEETRRTIEKDTRTAWFNATSGRSRIDSSRQEADFREKAKLAQEKSYELGAATIVNVLDAHRRLLKANTDYFKARYDFIRSLIRLRLNAGSLADLDLEAIEPWFGPQKRIKPYEPIERKPVASNAIQHSEAIQAIAPPKSVEQSEAIEAIARKPVEASASGEDCKSSSLSWCAESRAPVEAVTEQ